MRFGLSPMINAIGVIFVVITIAAAVTHVVLKRRRR
jgi:spermidine/putrescine transport system permease protein